MARWPQRGRVYFQHFMRVEERFFLFEDEYSPFAVRLRFQTGAKIPLNNTEIIDKTWFIRPYVEFFSEMGTRDKLLFPNITRYNFTLGYKFNPKRYKLYNVKKHLAQLKATGLGIFLLFKLMDRVEYKFENKKNHLILIKDISD